ncbi:major facilitator transporter [Caballeronia udeis]|uniref:Major facilitator transporter n=1 Tax=Caballeronia udeis TaxID=1232866 RepID=A0A158I4C2_9BURK|nr:major facilitator transporter [Caballeronia udeis]
MDLPLTSVADNAQAQCDERAPTFRKVTSRILPIMSLALFLNNMDRTNVGFAALTMNRDLGFTPAQFGWGAGILFFSLCFLDVLRNLVLVRFGARRWMTRIMIFWGLLSAATALVVLIHRPHDRDGRADSNIWAAVTGAACRHALRITEPVCGKTPPLVRLFGQASSEAEQEQVQRW